MEQASINENNTKPMNHICPLPIYPLEAFGEKASKSGLYIGGTEDHPQKYNFVSKPHKHDFYLLLYIINGGGLHTIDFNSQIGLS